MNRAAEAMPREGRQGPAWARRPGAQGWLPSTLPDAGISRPMRKGARLPEESGRAHMLPTGPYPSHLEHRMGWGDTQAAHAELANDGRLISK